MKRLSLKCSVWIISIVLFLLGLFFVAKQWQEQAWEKHLLGPFYGYEYTNSFDKKPVSTLKMPTGHSLEIYDIGDTNGPILSMLSNEKRIWSYILIPEDIDSTGSIRKGYIKDIQLRRLSTSSSNYKVYLTCDWYWGGKEGGIIYIEKDFSFKGFSLGW